MRWITNCEHAPIDRNKLERESQPKEKGRGLSIPSAHQEPNDQTTQAKSFEELRPGQAVGVERERSHHQIQNLFVLPNQRRAVRGVQLRNLLQLDLSELCHLW